MNHWNPLIESFLEMLENELGRSVHTLSAYKKDMGQWTLFVGELSPQEITSKHRQDYMEFLQDHGLGLRSIARNVSAIGQLMAFLCLEKTIEKNPWEHGKAPKYSHPLPQVLSLEEVQRVLVASRKDPSPEGIRLWLILEMLYATGMRISELVTLQLSQLPVEDEFSFIIRGKGGHERFVFLTPQAQEALALYLEVRPVMNPHNPYLFPSRAAAGHVTRQRVGQRLADLARLCFIEPSRLSPHGLRHAFATHLLRQGVDLMTLKKLLGHQDISTTQIYTHVQGDTWKALLNQYHPLSFISPEKSPGFQE